MFPQQGTNRNEYLLQHIHLEPLLAKASGFLRRCSLWADTVSNRDQTEHTPSRRDRSTAARHSFPKARHMSNHLLRWEKDCRPGDIGCRDIPCRGKSCIPHFPQSFRSTHFLDSRCRCTLPIDRYMEYGFE